MNYDADELFRFEKTEGGYAVAEYLKKEDPGVTELEIPEEYNGKPVVRIEIHSFAFAYEIKSLKLPKSLEEIGDCAFWHCNKLKSVILNSAPKLGSNVFFGCRLLPADVTLMGLVGSCDLSAPFDREDFAEAFKPPSRQFIKRLFEDYYAREAILSP